MRDNLETNPDIYQFCRFLVNHLYKVVRYFAKDHLDWRAHKKSLDGAKLPRLKRKWLRSEIDHKPKDDDKEEDAED